MEQWRASAKGSGLSFAAWLRDAARLRLEEPPISRALSSLGTTVVERSPVSAGLMGDLAAGFKGPDFKSGKK